MEYKRKFAERKVTLRVGEGDAPVTFTVEVSDDTERFTRGGTRPLVQMARPITVRWPFVTVTFHDPQEARLAFTAFGSLFDIHPDIRAAIGSLLGEIGIPEIPPY